MLREDEQKEINEDTKRNIYSFFQKSPKYSHSECILLPTAAHKEAQCLSCSVSCRTAYLQHKLYSLQLNCTYSNYTDVAATCSAAQQHSTFTVQILYKLYTLQLNCTYSNYTEAAATCSAAQQHRNCLLKCSTPGCFKLCIYQYIYIQSSRYIAPFKLTLLPHSTVSPVRSTTKHTQLFLCLELCVYKVISRVHIPQKHAVGCKRSVTV